jgi:hypothetical protein
MKCVETLIMSKEEWKELMALKSAISYNPASVNPEKMELFTQLLIKSFEHRGEAYVESVKS